MSLFFANKPKSTPSKRVTFGCTRLIGTNKKGVLTPDSEGCYTMVIGALNAHNSSEDFYVFEAAKSFFEESSSFQRRIKRGVVRAEYGHPKREQGMSINDYINRLINIDENRVCATFREIWFDDNLLSDEKGRKIIPIYGRIFPSGPFGEVLKKQLDTAGEQVCFSIRSLTEDSYNGRGGVDKAIRTLVTFDYVNEPGIWNAEKFLSPTLESLSEIVLDKESAEKEVLAGNNDTISIESNSAVREEIINAFAKVDNNANRPWYMDWK